MFIPLKNSVDIVVHISNLNWIDKLLLTKITSNKKNGGRLGFSFIAIFQKLIFGYLLTFFCHKRTLIFTYQIVKTFNTFWQLKPLTFINLCIPHSNIYWFTAENRIKTNLQDLDIFRPQKYIVALVTQFSALRQLNNMLLIIYSKNQFNVILFGFSFRAIFQKKCQALFYFIYFGKKVTLIFCFSKWKMTCFFGN